MRGPLKQLLSRYASITNFEDMKDLYRSVAHTHRRLTLLYSKILNEKKRLWSIAFVCSMHSSSTGYSGGSLNAYLSYTVTCSGQPMEESICYPSQKSLMPLHRPRRGRRLDWPGRDDLWTWNRMQATAGASSDYTATLPIRLYVCKYCIYIYSYNIYVRFRF